MKIKHSGKVFLNLFIISTMILPLCQPFKVFLMVLSISSIRQPHHMIGLKDSWERTLQLHYEMVGGLFFGMIVRSSTTKN